MKRIFIVILTTAFLYSVSATSVFNVQGMSCPVGCAPKVTNAALQIKGVEKCDVNFEESKATIVYDNEKVTEGEILAALKTNTTFKYASNLKNDITSGSKCSGNCSQNCCKKTEEKPKKSFFQRLFGL